MSEDTETPEAPETEATAVADKVEPVYEIPQLTHVNDLRALPLPELYTLLEALPIRIPANATKAQLVYELVAFYLKEGGECHVTGIVEQSKEAFGMLRDPLRSFKVSADDIYVQGQMLSEYGICVGQIITVALRPSRGRDKYLAADSIITIDGVDSANFKKPKDFDKLTAMFPDKRFVLERGKEGPVSVRVVDLVAPLGKGQRGLIVAPPRGGKTILLKQIAKSIQENHPESELVILLLDERPEEVTDFEETVNATVYSSTFDESHMRHAQVSDLALERAKRLVEQGKDVVLLLDSLTRLARGHNSAIRGGPVGSGGISSKALQQSRKFFNAARNCEEGGSLTILATALVETENRMDEVIFEEFKGTGNMEIKLDQELAERRVWPAIHIPQSGTRNDDRLYHKDEMAKVLDIRRQLSQLPVGDAIMMLIKNLERTSTNAELLLSGIR